MNIPDPWTVDGLQPERLLRELLSEVSERHPLFGKQVEVIAKRKDRDDVILKIDDERPYYAVVHLTWSGKKEPAPTWPTTKIFASWEELIALV